MNAEDYVISITSDDSYCSICLSTYESEWILGDAFMRGWYNIHDLSNMRMGFYSIDSSKKTLPEQATT